MGLLESWCLHLYQVCWNSPEPRSAHIPRQISEPGPMDPRANSGTVLFSFFKRINVPGFQRVVYERECKPLAYGNTLLHPGLWLALHSSLLIFSV